MVRRFVGSLKKDGEVRSLYHVLMFLPAASPFPWESIWRNQASSRVAFFVSLKKDSNFG
jgi:hypothetical protein